PEEHMPRFLNQSHARLSLGDYCVEVSECGLVPRLTITAPDGPVFRGREPGKFWLTRKGATLLLAGPSVAAAFVCAFLLNRRPDLPLWAPVMVFLLIALAVYLGAGLYWWWQPRPVDRSIDFAWNRLVPRLGNEKNHALFPSAEESAFLAGLALTTVSR